MRKRVLTHFGFHLTFLVRQVACGGAPGLATALPTCALSPVSPESPWRSFKVLR